MTTLRKTKLVPVTTSRGKDNAPRNGAFVNTFTSTLKDGTKVPSFAIRFLDEATGKRIVIFPNDNSPAGRAMAEVMKELADAGLIGPDVKFPPLRVMTDADEPAIDAKALVARAIGQAAHAEGVASADDVAF